MAFLQKIMKEGAGGRGEGAHEKHTKNEKMVKNE
jgi:hypothetical protein